MDRKSLRVLKFISHKSDQVKDYVLTNKFGENVQKQIDFHIDQNFIESIMYELDKSEPSIIRGKYAFEITPLGQSAIEEIFDRNIKSWLPICISVIALLKSFSEEIHALWLLTMQLLK